MTVSLSYSNLILVIYFESISLTISESLGLSLLDFILVVFLLHNRSYIEWLVIVKDGALGCTSISIDLDQAIILDGEVSRLESKLLGINMIFMLSLLLKLLFRNCFRLWLLCLHLWFKQRLVPEFVFFVFLRLNLLLSSQNLNFGIIDIIFYLDIIHNSELWHFEAHLLHVLLLNFSLLLPGLLRSSHWLLSISL